MKRDGTCVHFRGIQHKTCAAGIDMASMRDASQPGPYRWPCITLAPDKKATTTCPQFREPTAEEIAADEAAFQAALDRMRERTRNGECNECGTKVAALRQVGHCVYADPCGHRQGQGDASAMRKAMGLS